MSGLEGQRLFGGLVLLVTALFVLAGYAPAARWRRPLRGAAIGFFLLALLIALAEIVLWLAEPGG